MSDICIPITQQFHPREVCLHIGKRKGKKKNLKTYTKYFIKALFLKKQTGKNQIIFKITDRE